MNVIMGNWSDVYNLEDVKLANDYLYYLFSMRTKTPPLLSSLYFINNPLLYIIN